MTLKETKLSNNTKVENVNFLEDSLSEPKLPSGLLDFDSDSTSSISNVELSIDSVLALKPNNNVNFLDNSFTQLNVANQKFEPSINSGSLELLKSVEIDKTFIANSGAPLSIVESVNLEKLLKSLDLPTNMPINDDRSISSYSNCLSISSNSEGTIVDEMRKKGCLNQYIEYVNYKKADPSASSSGSFSGSLNSSSSDGISYSFSKIEIFNQGIQTPGDASLIFNDLPISVVTLTLRLSFEIYKN